MASFTKAAGSGPWWSLPVLIFCLTAANAGQMVLWDSWCGDLESPTRIAVDRTSHAVYVSSPRSGSIGIYDPSGTLQTIITTVAAPTALAVGNTGHIYVVDGTAIRKLQPDGSVVQTIGGDAGVLLNPHDLAVAADGRIFVADNCDSIKVFDAAGSLVLRFSRRGYPVGYIEDAVALSIDDAANELYIADQNNYRVQVFSLNGLLLRTWGSRGGGDYIPGQFLRLWGIDWTGNRLWAFDSILDYFQVFTATGEPLEAYAVSEPLLRTGIDIAVDGDRIYLTAPTTHCVLVFGIEPDAPYNLVIRPTEAGMALHWRAVPGATGYRVLRAGTPDFAAGDVDVLGTVTDTFFVDASALPLWEQRFYHVQAVSGSEPMPLSSEYPLAGWVDEAGEPAPVLTNHDSPHHVTHGVNCTSCHFSRFAYPRPLPTWWRGEHLCQSCHIETGKAQPQQNHFTAVDTIYCTACHSPHFHQDQFERYFIRSAILTPGGTWQATPFNHATDFVHGGPRYDGICEVCHTQTAYHRRDGGGASHHFGEDCLSCHSHMRGFRPPDDDRR